MNDAYALVTGKDMKTGKKTSRAKAAVWVAAGFLPIGKVAKLGKMSAKGLNALSKGSKAAKSIKKSRAKSSSTSKNKAKKNSEAKAKAAAKARAKAKKNQEAKAKNNTGKKASGAKVPNSDFGVVQSIINVANGQTRFTPLRKSGEPVSAGFDHVFEGHFDRPSANSRSIFSTSSDNLKQILQSPNLVKSPAIEIPGGQYKRIVDTGEIIGNTALKHGGNLTSWIVIYTDRAGNFITTYPIPKP